MKKKIVTLMLAFIIILSLTACGSKLSDSNTRIAESVVNTVDNYLDGYISISTAYNTVCSAYDRIDKTEDNDTDNMLFSTDVVLIESELGQQQFNGTGDIDYIIEKRNDIAKKAGLKKRK